MYVCMYVCILSFIGATLIIFLLWTFIVDLLVSKIALQFTQILEKRLPYSLQPTVRITPSDAGSSSKNDDARNAYTRLLECLRLNEPSCEALDEIDDKGNFKFFSWKWPSSSSKNVEVSAPSEALSSLNLVDAPQVSKENAKDSIKENLSYEPLLLYLQSHRETVHSANVADGKRIESKRLFNQDIYSLRSKAGVSARDEGENVLLRYLVSGATDIVVLNSTVPVRIGRHNVKFAVEIKTPSMLQASKYQGPLREAIVQLIGLNADNLNNAPPVLLTNLVNFHLILHLTMSSENPLCFDIIPQKCANIQSALNLALKLSELPAIGRNFARAPTPVFDEHGTFSLLSFPINHIVIFFYHIVTFFYFF